MGGSPPDTWSSYNQPPAQAPEFLLRLICNLDDQNRLIAISSCKTDVKRTPVGVAVHNLSIQHPDVLAPKLGKKFGVLLAKALHLLQQRLVTVFA